MRTLFGLWAACTFIAAPLVPATPAPAPSDALAALAGHWRCTADGRAAERSYYTPGYIPGPSGRSTPPEIFGRQDTTERDGSPSASFERIRETSAGVRVEAAEGSGTAPTRTSPMHFAGRSFDDLAAFELTYTVAGDTLQRTATRNGKTIADETCTREPEPPATPACNQPDLPARVLEAAEPFYPAQALATHAEGVVQVLVVLDDRSHVVWTDVQSSPSVLLNDEAVRSARSSKYRGAIRNCRPVPATYIFSVDFSMRR